MSAIGTGGGLDEVGGKIFSSNEYINMNVPTTRIVHELSYSRVETDRVKADISIRVKLYSTRTYYILLSLIIHYLSLLLIERD
jgi:hypothetical protein